MKRTKLFLLLLLLPYLALAQQWRSVSDGINHSSIMSRSVRDMIVVNDTLLIIGKFDSLYNPPQYCSGLAGWDSSQWHCKGPVINLAQTGHCITTFQNEVYVGGDGTSGTQPNIRRIGRYDGNQFQPLGRGIYNGTVYCMQEYNGSLYVGGNFTTVDSSLNARRIARWDGSQWHKIGTGLTGGLTNLFAMTVYKGELYIGGNFSSIDGFPSFNISRFNGVTWDSVGGGVNGFIRSMVVDTINDLLYVGGSIGSAGGQLTPTGVAAWDGSNWYPVGTAPLLNPEDMVIYRGKLFAGGALSFPNALGQMVHQMAWFDGQNWIPVCDTMDGGVIKSMCVYKDELYVGGYFQMIDDSMHYGIACTHFPNVSIAQAEPTEQVADVFPNPFSSNISIRLKHPGDFIMSYEVTTLAGEVQLSSNSIREKEVMLNLNNLAQGVYLLRFKTNRGIYPFKIIKN